MPSMEPQPAPIDYLIIGHVARDLTPQGPTLGGTVSYAGRTLTALGAAVGAVTSCAPQEDLSPLQGMELVRIDARHTTTFENRYHAGSRRQRLLRRARPLRLEQVPAAWRAAPLVHLAPVADELEPKLAQAFPGALRVATPQGWLRRWDQAGQVSLKPWSTLLPILPLFDAAVLSIEDLGGQERAVDQLAQACPLLAVTRGAQGATLLWRGQRREIPAPAVQELDPTGAGDVFAAALFYGLQHGLDPWQAAQGATLLAATSVTRPGLQGTPTPAEAQACLAGVTP